MNKYAIPCDVFLDPLSLIGAAWRIRIDKEILPHTWATKGAALAGLDVECRRRGIHKLAKDCWCEPEVVTP